MPCHSLRVIDQQGLLQRRFFNCQIDSKRGECPFPETKLNNIEYIVREQYRHIEFYKADCIT